MSSFFWLLLLFACWVCRFFVLLNILFAFYDFWLVFVFQRLRFVQLHTNKNTLQSINYDLSRTSSTNIIVILHAYDNVFVLSLVCCERASCTLYIYICTLLAHLSAAIQLQCTWIAPIQMLPLKLRFRVTKLVRYKISNKNKHAKQKRINLEWIPVHIKKKSFAPQSIFLQFQIVKRSQQQFRIVSQVFDYAKPSIFNYISLRHYYHSWATLLIVVMWIIRRQKCANRMKKKTSTHNKHPP